MRDSILFTSFLSSLLPIVAYFRLRARNKGMLWVIPVYAAAAFTADAIGYALTFSANKVAEFVYPNSFTHIEVVTFCILIFYLLRNPASKKFVIGCGLFNTLFFFFTIYHAFTITPAENPQTSVIQDVFTTTEQLSIIILSILFFYEQMNNPSVTFIYETKEFWLVTAYFFVTVSTLTLFVTKSILSRQQTNDGWVISQVANITRNIILVIGLSRPPRVKLT